MGSEIGVGLIGTGFMGKCHALAYGSVKAVFGSVPTPRRLKLCDADADLARQRAEEYGFAEAVTDWRTIIADPAIQLVSITTPNALHREMAEAALAAGKHVWCEKPMGLTLADAESMAAAGRSAGVRTQLGYNYLRNPLIAEAKRLIESGEIGRITHFRGVVDEDYMADAEIPWSWRCQLAEAGLGALGDIMVHLVSLAHALAGRVEKLTAQIETIHKTRPLPDRPGETGRVENEDAAQALVRFASGASGLLTCSRAAWGRKNRLAFEIHGTRGTLIFDQERMNELQLFTATGAPATRGFRTILTAPAHPPYGLFCPAPGHGLGFNDLKVIELAALLRAIDGTPDPLAVDFTAGLAIERVIHAMVMSAQSKAWVAV